MTAEEVRKALGERTFARLREEGLTPAAVRHAVDDLGTAVALVPEWERREIAARAAALYPKVAAAEADEDVRLEAMASEDPAVRASASVRLDAAGAWIRAEIAGSLAPDAPAPSVFDPAAFCRAVAVAWREAASPRLRKAIAALQEAASVSLPHERDGLSRWDAAFDAAKGAFVGNGRAAGLSRDAALAGAFAAALVLRGRALQAAYRLGSDVVFLAGSAAPAGAGAPRSVPKGAHPAMAALAGLLRQMNDLRIGLRPSGTEEELFERLGLAAEKALARPAPSPAGSVRALGRGRFLLRRHAAAVRVQDVLARRLAPLTLRAAVRRLEALIGLLSRTKGLERLAESLREDMATCSPHVSFARHVGLPDAPVRLGRLREGMGLHEAAPSGRLPAWRVCAGERGRPVRCRAVADDDGNVVGYRAFDALSGEYHGRPTYALYGLDGRRAGHLFAGEERARLGDPRHGFVTAPETIPLGHPALA